MQHPTQSLTEVVRILHIMHSSTQLDTTHPSTLTTASPPAITTLRFLARTLNIPTAHDTFTHPQPNPTHYQHAYSQAATICPCPPRHNMRPHHSVLYQFCEQLAKSIPRPITAQSHIPMRCPTCTITPHTSTHHTLCTTCIAFALLTQNSYANRWNTILVQPTQIHTSPLPPMTPTNNIPPISPQLESTHTSYPLPPPPPQPTTSLLHP